MAAKPIDWKVVFLEALRTVPVIRQACEAAGVDRTTAWRARQADEGFADAWDHALEAGIDGAEQEAFRRAVQGWEQGVWHQGVLVGTERRHSDAMLSLVLKGRRKSVYADRTEHTGADGGPMRSQSHVVIVTGVPEAGDNSDLA
jgi:hypothetical protein